MTTRPKTFTSTPPADRRREPRVPVGIPATVTDGRALVAGQAVDASSGGLLIELCGPLLLTGHDVTVKLGLPGAGPVELAGTIVGARPREAGVRLAVRLATPIRLPAGAAAALPPVPCASGPRPRAVAGAELGALGTAALALSARGPSGPVPEGLATWLEALAEELGVERPSPPATARDLVAAVAALEAVR